MKVNEIRHRDAYQRDYDSSVSGMGNRQSQAYQDDGGANDERHDLDPSEWYIVKDGKMFKVTVYPNQEQQAMEKGFSRSRDEARAKASSEGVDEDSGMLKVAKDDDKQTILQNPSTGVQTQIDKTNPNAPRLTQNDTGKLELTAPATSGAAGGAPEAKPNLVGKDVTVSQNNESAELLRWRKIAGLAENDLSNRMAQDVAATAGMKPQEFAPGEIKPSQLYGHPKWRETVQAMHKKYPTNKEQAMQAARDAVTQMIKQGK